MSGARIAAVEPPKVDEIAARVDELRAKRAKIAEDRRQREIARAPAELLALEEQGLADDQAIEAAEIEHGPVGKQIMTINTDLGVIIVKRSHPNMFKRFQDKGSTRTEDLDKLVRHCLVHPDPPAFDRILKELPASLLRCADAVSFLAGVRMEDVTGK
jgi:outer membrane murein-binding lipoprotein Lpp